MNQFVILSFGVDPLNWPSFIEIGEIACSRPAWCTHGLTLKPDFAQLLMKVTLETA